MSDDRVMEPASTNRQDGPHMSEVPLSRPRRRLIALALVALGVGAVVVYAMLPAHRQLTLGGDGLIAITNGVAAVVMFWGAGQRGAWRSARYLAAATALLAISAAALYPVDATHTPIRPRVADALFLLFLLPVLGAARQEYIVHLPKEDRRELAIDAALIAASFAAIGYIVIRPIGAETSGSISAASFAILAAVLVSAFGVLAIWVPARAHVLQWIVFVGVALATCVFGWEWTQGAVSGIAPPTDVIFMLAGPALAALTIWYVAPASTGDDEHPIRLAQPILTSVSVVAACGALITVANLDDARHLAPVQSAAIITLLGVGVAARILANQLRSTRANEEARGALREKEHALAEADSALGRVREANETLRDSEEHLRLVFETAVDGIVELDERDVILRANDAFCQMVRLDHTSIEGLAWSALAASVSGSDGSFGSLLTTGQGTIQRPEGQPLYLESRISQVPMTPPRRLLLVRDVTAGRIADQTIRSLFKFLQDRDEDRTRLLRRINSAIESERNRIARDLHDGPVQGVSAASLSLEAALLMIKAGEVERGMEVLGKVRKELAEEADALRGLMSGLRPPLLEERGLIPAIRETLARFGTEHSVRTEFSGTIGAAVSDDLETLAYRVVQEALSNAAKHAAASHVSVSVESDQTQLRIEIEDDGMGFDSGRAREFLRMGRVGLASMRERVELASGTFVVRSTGGRGTSIVATLPLDTVPAGREVPVSDRR